MTTNQLSKTLFFGGGVFLLAGTVANFFENEVSMYVFSFGAALIIIYQFMESLKVRKISDRRVQRLRRLAFLSSTLLAPAAYLMFTYSNLWVVLVLIYAITTLFLSFRGNE